MQKPVLYYNNSLRTSQSGDDGTAYATCAEALVDPADAFRVRGAIVPATDNSALTDLSGFGLKFYTTGNKYSIVDSSLLMSILGSYTVINQSANNDITALATDGTSLYAATYNGTTKITIIKLSLPDLSLVDHVDINSASKVVALVIIGDNIHAVIDESTPLVKQYDASTLTLLGTLTLDAGDSTATCAVANGTDLLIGCSTSPGRIVKVDASVSPPTRTTHLALTASGINKNNVTCVCMAGTDLFAGCGTASPTYYPVIKCDPSAMTEGINLGLTSAATALHYSGGYVFAARGSSPARVHKIDPATISATGYVDLATGEVNVTSFADDGTFLYASCNISNASKIVRINPAPATPVRIEVMDLGWAAGTSCPIVCTDGYVYAGSRVRTPAQIAQVNSYAYCTLYERLQDADVGDSFTLRAGLVCASQAPTRPAFLAADCHIAPRFQGTDNTALHLYIHAPNLVSDGGFESAAFSPHWTAETGWTVTSADELEGQYAAIWDVAASKYLQQSGTSKLKKGVTYTLLFKAKSKTASPTAGCLTVTAKQTVSGTNLDSDVTGYQPAVTTTATWFSVDITPDFDCSAWTIKFAGDSTKKGSATAVIVDEVYFYEKKTVNTLIVDRHNWAGRLVTVKSWKLSPLRSTAASDANNSTQVLASTPDTSGTLSLSLTSSTSPVYEIILPAVSGWIPEAGEIYLGDSWQLPRFPGSLDPWETGEGNLREIKLSFGSLPPSYRTSQIEPLFEKLRAGEAVYLKWDADDPLLVEDTDQRKSSPFSPYTVSLSRTFRERL